MKNLLCILLLLTLSGLAFGQVNLPPCDPNNTGACTDYFGVANWANSPLPAGGGIARFTVQASGSGYSDSTAVFITDTAGTGATAGTVSIDVAGGVTAIAVVTAGSGYVLPQVTIVDYGTGGTLAFPTCGATPLTACGSGALATAVTAPVGGIRKFVDTLTTAGGGLTLAQADQVTFPGSDYYVIGLMQYSTQMHTDLPATTLRGYCQLNIPSSPGVCNPSYLGPTIIAQKNRPVRVLFKNMLPTSAGGNLFIPVDTTYMGAGAPYKQNEATLHLHGGATPWISDGTPHQWTVPKGETGQQRGVSAQLVPDMWFDTNGNVIPGCAGTPICAVTGATNDPGPGNLTFYWTNQQGGRLMFYHDHALGLTRLNVYAGEAAGYLLYDPVEETALKAASVPGTITATPDLAHLVPLVIQDKTFVPSAAQLAAQDPTWTIGRWGTIPGSVNTGDLWFPHVYTPNQNPADPGGGNAFGRWDYGPWTLPGAQTTLLAANPASAVQLPCTSTAFFNLAVNCPITPNPSGTPEGFLDTPLVNGKAYPVLHVAPEAYRFKILTAGNDRSWNLQLYLADPAVTTPDGRKNTEVKMVPSIQPAPGAAIPLCTQVTPITNTALFIGLASALLDASGNPINGTGLPANCWPTFGVGTQTAGIPIQQTMWAADGRVGGVPDPTRAGPPFIQIGTEGGLLPAPVVIPSMPTGYEANTRSVTITNVSVHGLWLGPAERADAIVDFSKFAGKTLILYNDAPTPAPAQDSRTDYFTGDPDQTPIGGAPSTLPGYGPNTRTIMQIVVDGTPSSTTAFSLNALKTALPGIFGQTQPVPIVPEPTYPVASGGYSPVLTQAAIQDSTLTFIPVGSTTPVTYTDFRKAIQELFTLDYGRMNATLGVELPLTNYLTQTTIPLGYIDPPTEIIKQGDTQLWKITHNGVDTHFMHFHLFNVQVINRMGWDGSIRAIEANELGWKDTVRMNPLEDILVALKPITPVLPFPIRDSYRLLDVTMPAGSNCPGTFTTSPMPCSIFTNIDPNTNIGVRTPNAINNFGWEYVWHCHILGHEENDMMRAISFQVPPEAPSNLAVATATTGLTLTWTDNSASETGFTLQRAADPAFTEPISITVPPIALSTDANGQGLTWGGTLTYNDTAATGASPYFYRVEAFKPDATYWTPSGTNITSAWSNTASFGGLVASVSPTSLAFGLVSGTSAPQTVTLSNTSSGTLAITSIAASAPFAVSSTTCGNLAGNSSCTISVTFTGTVPGPQSGTLTIVNNSSTPSLTVPLTGTGGTQPLLTITASTTTMKYGATTLPVITASYNPPNPALTAQPTCTTIAIAATATVKGSSVGTYTTSCSGAAGPYAITYVTGLVAVTPVPLTIWASNGSMAFMGTVATINPLYVGLVNGDTAASPPAPTCTTTATSTSNVGTYPSSCSGAVDTNYTISYVNGTVTVAQGVLTITAPSPTMTYGGPVPILTPIYSPANPAGLTAPAICTTTATASSPVGTYPVTCSGATSLPGDWTFTYVAGTLTVVAAVPQVTFTAPASANYNASFAVTATTNASTMPTITGTAGICSVSAVGGTPASATATVTMLSGTGTCGLTASWAASTNYLAATLTRSTLAVRIAPTVTFTGAPASAIYNTSFTVATTTNSTATAVITSSGACSNVGTLVTMTSGTGTCGLTATWAADPNYAGTTATRSTTAAKAASATAITANTPNPSTLQQPVTVSVKVTGTGTIPPTGTVTVNGGGGITCPATLTSGAGSCQLTFTSAGAKTLTATYVPGSDPNFLTSTSAGVSQTVNAPTVSLSPPNMNFGNTTVLNTSAVKTETITNTGTGALTNFSWSITGTSAGDFNIASTTCTTTLAPGANCLVNITFKPTATGSRTAGLRLTDNATNSPQTVGLSGTGK